MPQYMLLIYGPAEGGPSPEQMQAEMPRWFEYTQELRDAGAFVAGDALEAADGVRTVRLRSGARQVTDGPVAGPWTGSAATTSSTCPTGARPRTGRRGSRARRTARSRSGRSWSSPRPPA